MTCVRTRTGRCEVHGSQWLHDECGARRMTELVVQERAFQFRNYGDNRDLDDGSGPTAKWLYPVSGMEATKVEQMFRHEYNQHKKPTWAHLVREELAEAIQEDDPEAQMGELLQVAALCVSWAEKIAERSMTLQERFDTAFQSSEAIQLAAEDHVTRANSENRGSDEFRWALTIVLGYGCLDGGCFQHEPVRDPEAVKDWIKTEANLAEHDGDVDYIGLFQGVYNEYV